MIQITRAQARLIRAVLRKSAPIGSARNYRPPLALHAGEDGLRVRIHAAEVAVEWHNPGTRPPDTIVLPGQALDDFEGAKDAEVALTLQGNDLVQARWNDGGVPQSRDYATVPLDKLSPFPEEPKKFTALDTTFLKALDDASQTASHENSRFALKNLQLRGKAGELASTNGRELLLQRGFAFPFKDDVLIPSIGVFGGRELAGEPVAMGKSDKHVCLRVGPWKFFFEINDAARFPRIESAIPMFAGKSTILRMAPDDASFLIHALPRLPGREDNEQVTVDLNGHAAIRAREEDQNRVTELRLSRSEVVGPAVRFVSNRQFLAHALRLGLTEFHVTRPDSPIVGRDKTRLFVWVPLDQSAAIPPKDDATRIDSINNTETTPEPTQRRMTMPAQQPNGHGTNGTSETDAARQERGGSIVELITEAEELRTVMLDASARLTRLLSGLKQHRRQSRAVQAAMHSLQQLKLGG